MFQGAHRHAVSDFSETDSTLTVFLSAHEGTAKVQVLGRVAKLLIADSVFHSVEAASRFLSSGHSVSQAVK